MVSCAKPPVTFAIQIPLQSTVPPRRTSSYSPYLSAGTPPRSPRQPKESHPDAHRYTFLFLTLVVPSADQVIYPDGHVREVQNRIDELRREQQGLTFLYLSVLVFGARSEWVYVSQMPFQIEPLGVQDLEVAPGCALFDGVGMALEHAVDVLESNKKGPRVRYRVEVWEAGTNESSADYGIENLKKLLQNAHEYEGFDGLLVPENGSLHPLLIAK